MAESFQKEIPRSRINITLDVETNGARKKKELPLKLLVMGDFSGGKTKGSVAKRERININKNNFEQVLSDLRPEIEFTAPNRIKNDDTEMRIKIVVDSLKKFHPEAIVKEIPELSNLIAMRNLLKDFKSNLLDNNALRRELEKLIKDQQNLKLLQNELQTVAPLDINLLPGGEQL